MGLKFLWVLWIFGCILIVACAKKPTQPDTTPAEITISASSSSITSGSSLQCSAIASLLDGTTDDVTEKVIWSNRPGRAGIIQEGGLFVAYIDSIGKETIQADYQGQTATMEIEVIIRAVSLSIWPNEVTIRAGETLQFQATVVFQDFSQASVTEQVEWSVSPGKTGTIDSHGQFQSIPEMTGLEIITARFQNLTVTSRVRVLDIDQIQFEMVPLHSANTMVFGCLLRPSGRRPAVEGSSYNTVRKMGTSITILPTIWVWEASMASTAWHPWVHSHPIQMVCMI